MLGNHPAIQLPQSTEYAKEMRKWESQHTKWGPPGRPYKFEEFPKMLYKAAYESGKGIHIEETHVVNNEDEQANMRSRGFHLGPDEAFAVAQRELTEHGRLAAEREHEIKVGRHSEGAVKEIRAAEEAYGARHLPDVPETPIAAKNSGVSRAK